MVNTLTLNPAVDKVLYLEKLEKNITSRIQKQTDTIGGKGTHVSINLRLLGMDNRAFGISHGETGQKIVNILEGYGVDVCFIHKEMLNSRTNYLLVENTGDCTVIADKGVELTQQDLDELLLRMKNEIQDEDFLVLSGDASNCSNPLVYNELLDGLKSKHLKVFLDTSGESLKHCISDSPFLIKPNLDELSTLCGREITPEIEDVVDAIQSLSRYQIEVIAVSLGKNGSVVKAYGEIYRAFPPSVTVCNTVGCGDCFLAGLIYGIQNDYPITETIRLATAVSAATAESPLSAGFDPVRAQELLKATQVEKL